MLERRADLRQGRAQAQRFVETISADVIVDGFEIALERQPRRALAAVDRAVVRRGPKLGPMIRVVRLVHAHLHRPRTHSSPYRANGGAST